MGRFQPPLWAPWICRHRSEEAAQPESGPCLASQPPCLGRKLEVGARSTASSLVVPQLCTLLVMEELPLPLRGATGKQKHFGFGLASWASSWCGSYISWCGCDDWGLPCFGPCLLPPFAM